MNNPNRTVNDSQSGTNKLNATLTTATHRSDEQNRYYRSVSGYPSGPEYVSSSRKHEKQLSSSRNHRMGTESTDSQPYLHPSQTRHRDAYPDPTHGRSTQATPLTSKKYDSSGYRPGIQPEEAAQSQTAKYELWIPPSQHSPSSQQNRYNRDKHEKEREGEKERQRVKDEHRHERREPTDTRERHKRRQEEGESDWDRDRERRDRERHKGRDHEKVRDQDRQRPKEEYTEKRRDKPENDSVARMEREQRKYTEMVLQKAEEKETAREQERERRRQEKEKEKERERNRERKPEEKADERISKTDIERDKEKERKRERRERENRREIESGRESERDPDRRRRKRDLEQGKERKKLIEVPVATYDGPRREVEFEETRRMQDVARRHKMVAIDSGPVSKDQEAERNRYAPKDLSNAHRKDYEKVQNLGDESEADRVRHLDKENVVRREHKLHEKAKRSGTSRPYTERGTDSERELHRDVAFPNRYMRETVLSGTTGPETAIAPFSKSLHHPRDDKGLITQARTSSAHPNDGYAPHSYPIPVSRPIDTSSTAGKYSPISVVSANGESPRLDSTGSEVVRTKQASSSHRTLKRQSRIATLVPEQITVLPSKHSQPQDTLQLPVDIAPPSHVPRRRKDSGRLLPAETLERLSPQTNQALPLKADFRSASSMAPLPTRVPTRDSTIIPQFHVIQDKRSPEALQVPQKDLQGSVPTPESFPQSVGIPGIPANNLSGSPSVSRANQDLRTAIKGPDMSTPVPTQFILAPPVEKVVSSSSTKPSARSTNHSPAVNDIPLRRPYSALGESSPQERGKEKLVPISSTGLSTSPGTPQAYPVDRSISFDTQHSNGISELQPATPFRRLATGMFESKQEGLQSRGHPLAPIPENATVTASHRPASRLQIDLPSQPSVSDKRSPPEPTSATRVAFRSISEPIGAPSRPQTDHTSQQPVAVADKRVSEPTSSTRRSVSESSGAHSLPVVKMKPIKSGRDESKRAVTESYHISYSVNPEIALRSLTGQHKHDDLVVYSVDSGREEVHAKYSPTASSRREVVAQPSMNKGPNANDTSATLRPGHVRAYSSNHCRMESSPGKTAEGPFPVISFSPSSRPIEEKRGHVAQAFLQEQVNEPDTCAPRDLDTKDRNDRLQFTEHEPMAAVSQEVALSNTAPVVMPQLVSHDGQPGNGHDSKNSEYHQSIQRPQHPALDIVPREQDVIRKQRREGSKKLHSPNKDQVQFIYKEEHDHHRLPLDNRNTSHHEGLAHSGKKTESSPVTSVPQNSFPQPDPQSTFSEIDSRHGTPKNVLQSSPGQHPANSIVKAPNQGVKSDSNQGNSPEASVPRLHKSPRYPHSVNRSSSSYATANNAIQQSTTDYSEIQPSSHIPTNHSHSRSPSIQQMPFLPSRDTRESTPVVAHNEQPLPDSTEGGNKTSSKYLRSQPKELVSASPRSAQADSSRMTQSKPFNPLANPQVPEPTNYQTTSFHMVQPDINKRIVEPNPPSSLLFSKGIDHSSPYTPPENKSTGDSRSMSNNHLARAVESSHGPSPNDQDFEMHEPRLITPKSQKLAEFSELQQRSTHYDDVKANALEPYHEINKKSAAPDMSRSSRIKASSDQTHSSEIWLPAPSREYEHDHAVRRHVVSVTRPGIPTVLQPQPSTSIGMVLPLDEEAAQTNIAQNIAPAMDMKVYRYLREKRNRTISILSMEAQDGTATSTLGSPTASVLSQPPIRVPSHRDPIKAAHEWLSENREAATRHGKTTGKRRILRPGVVFDLGEDPPPTERRHRPRSSRSKTQPTHT